MRDLPPTCKGSLDITVMDWSGKNIQQCEVGNFRKKPKSDEGKV